MGGGAEGGEGGLGEGWQGGGRRGERGALEKAGNGVSYLISIERSVKHEGHTQ